MAMQINKIKRKLAKNKHVESELFDVHNIMEYGFPTSPSAIAYDDQLGLLALATGTGELRVYGKSGVLVNGQHEKKVSSVSQIAWIPNEGRIVTLAETSGQSVLTLFELNTKSGAKSIVLEPVKDLVIDTKKATTFSLIASVGIILIGTEVGDTLVLDAASFELKEDTIHLDVAMQSVPEDLKLTPGSVQVVVPHPSNKELVLIGFHVGLLIVWNLEDKLAQGTFYVSCESLESASWSSDGNGFVTAHSDGSYYSWTLDVECKPVQTFPFAELAEPAQKLGKVEVSDDFLVFTGGLPKLTYASTHSFAVKQGETQVNYETSSKILDFQIIHSQQEVVSAPQETTEETQAPSEEATEESPSEEATEEAPSEEATEAPSEEATEAPEPVMVRKASALAVLTEDELIIIDLLSAASEDGAQPQWPAFKKPYLNSASPNDVTCLYVYEDSATEANLIEKLSKFDKAMFADKSTRDWPIFGGSSESAQSSKSNVVVTGHYDGSLRFYDVNDGKFSLLYSLNLNNYFLPEDLEEDPAAAHESLGDVELRKVGEDFGSSGDDNRFAVCKLYICPKSEKLFVGTHSGQVVVFEMEEVDVNTVQIHEVKIVPDEAGFKWKGCHPAKLKELAEEQLPEGYSLKFVVQCEPPAPITSMAVNEKYGLIAAGTSHGFGVFDIEASKAVLTRSTLVENDEAASGAKLSKSKSLREGIRNSFRRLKPKKTESSADSSTKAKTDVSSSKIEEAKVEEEKPKEEETKPAEVEPEKTEEAGDKPVESEVPAKDAEETEEVEKAPEAAGDAPASEETKPDEPEEPKEEEAEEKPAETEPEAPAEPTETVAEKVEEQPTEEKEEPPKEEEVKPEEPKPEEPEAAGPSDATAVPAVTIVETEEQKEDASTTRVVEARGERQDKTMMSTVRYLFFADTFLRNSKDSSPSLWVGTHAGSVYSYLVTLPEEREGNEAKLRLAKEIKLLHRAPVVYMNILDHSGFPLPDLSAVAVGKESAADMSGHHHLLVCSEEQMKLFTLPALKSKYKEKLTAVHGLKVRKAAPIKHRSDSSVQNFLACMLNDGSVCTFSLPALFRQYNYDLVNSENKIASMFTEFSSEGCAYVLQSTNLIKQYALFKDTESPLTVGVELPEGVRPLPPVEPEPFVEEPEKPADEEAVEEVKEETAEAEKVENVESVAPAEDTLEEKPEEEKEAEEADEEPQDLPTVEEEAKKMIDDAEDLKDEEFHRRIQEELTPDNPELTTTTVTTYRAIESRTIISSDDGTQCAKIITTTRDTTLSLDGDVITQKTQQKEEFEISPSDEQAPTEEEPAAEDEEPKKEVEVTVETLEDAEDKEREEVTTVVQTVTVVDATGEEKEIEHQTVVETESAPAEEEQKSGNVTSDDEMNQAEVVLADTDGAPVRTATLTQNEEVEPTPAPNEDQITHHIGGHETGDEAEADEPVEVKNVESVESAPAVEIEVAVEPTEEQPAELEEKPAEVEATETETAEEPDKVEEEAAKIEDEPTEPETTEKAEDESAETPAEEPEAEKTEETAPVVVETSEEPSEAAPAEEDVENGVTGACYGGSQGELYSPLGRENGETASADIVYNETEATPEETQEPNGDVNGHEEQPNGHQNGIAENGTSEATNETPSENGQAESGTASPEPAQNEDEVIKKAAIASEQNTVSDETSVEVAASEESKE